MRYTYESIAGKLHPLLLRKRKVCLLWLGAGADAYVMRHVETACRGNNRGEGREEEREGEGGGGGGGGGESRIREKLT